MWVLGANFGSSATVVCALNDQDLLTLLIFKNINFVFITVCESVTHIWRSILFYHGFWGLNPGHWASKADVLIQDILIIVL